MALTKINLAQGVTGTLSTSNYVDSGKVLQIINSTNNTNTASTTTSFADTGLTATITPSSSSSKVLVLVEHSFNTYASGNMVMKLNLLRDSTTIISENRLQYGTNSGTYFQNNYGTHSMTILDNPSSSSSLIYKTQFKRSEYTGTPYACNVNTSGGSTITLMEIQG